MKKIKGATYFAVKGNDGCHLATIRTTTENHFMARLKKMSEYFYGKPCEIEHVNILEHLETTNEIEVDTPKGKEILIIEKSDLF